MTTATYLEDYFSPVTEVLTPELARAIIDLEPNTRATARVIALGQKANAGTLTDEERDEYKAYVDAGDVIAVFKAKARRFLAQLGA